MTLIRRRISMATILIAMAAGLVGFGAAESASAATTTLYVSTTGTGTACTTAAPCSIAQAQIRVRALASAGDVTVQLAAGTYRQTASLKFTAADGGTGSNAVSWVAAPGAAPVITGAQAVTGWTLFNSTTGVYSASIPTGLDSRNLYVNTVSAPRASITISRSDISITPTGFTINNSALNYLSTLPQQSRIEFEATSSFTDRYAPVASISGTTVTMAQPAWKNNLWGYDTLQSPYSNPIWKLENSLSFLTSEGQWYIDPAAGKLYYKPAAGVDPNTLSIELPKLQSLVSIGGSYAAPVTNLTFRGITFSGTSWLGPSSTNGYANQQTGTFMSGSYSYYPSDAITSCREGCPAFERARTTWNQIPAGVQVAAASGVSFVGNRFENLGQVGLGIGNDNNAHETGLGLGAKNIKVVGNIFTNLGGGAITAGGVQADAHHPAATNMINESITIENNTVSGVSQDYKENAGILSTYVTAAVIRYNEVTNVPYDGIDIGFGWGVNDPGGVEDYVNMGYYQYNPMYSTPTTLKNNIISNNLVHNTKSLFHDGGSIYNLSANPGTVIQDNYMYDMKGTIGLYLDDSSRYLSVKNNVVQDASWWIFFHSKPTNNTKDNKADNNYHNTGAAVGNYNDASGNTLTNDQPVSGLNWPAAAQKVICNSGVQAPFRTALNATPCAYPAVTSGYSTYSSTPAAFSQSGSQFAIAAAGADIWGAGGQHDDAYGAIYQAGSVTSDTTVSARVDQQNDANSWAKTGVVIRNNITQAGSAAGYAVVTVTPNQGIAFQWDSNGDGFLDGVSGTGFSVNTSQPLWVRLVRSGTQVSGFYSTDGATFTQIGTAQTLAGAAATQDGGIIATSHDVAKAAVNLVSGLQIINSLASGYKFLATGNSAASQSGTSVSLGGSGFDIWGAGGQHDDAYATVYKPAAVGSTGSVSAKVVQTDTNVWAKSGVVLRANLAQPGTAAGYAAVLVTPANGVSFQWDANGDGYFDNYANTGYSVNTGQPLWVKLTRSGTQVSGFYSLDGITYVQIGSAQTLAGATAMEDGGVISTSHDVATFKSNSFTELTIG